jgi:hypothetical protein
MPVTLFTPEKNLFADHKKTKLFEKKYKKSGSPDTLNLSRCRLTADDMPILSAFLKANSTITCLILDHNTVGAGLPKIAAHPLVSISLANNELTDQDIIAFTNAIKAQRGLENNLAELDVTKNQLTDSGAKAPVTSLQGTDIHVTNNHIRGTQGLLLEIKNRQYFTLIDLAQNPLTQAAKKELTEITQQETSFVAYDEEKKRSPWYCCCFG